MTTKPTGRLTAAEARGDAEAVTAIADATGLTAEIVAERLRAAHGAQQVRNLFREQWPRTPDQLAFRNVKFARTHQLHHEIRRVVRTTGVLVSKRLNAAHGAQLLKNVFWDWWPAENEPRSLASEPAGVDEDDDDDADVPATVRTESAVPPPLGPGALLSGRYTILRELGRGGFGTTWVAHDALSDLDLVIKIPHEEDGGAIRNELRRAFRVVHPNICQAFPDRDDDTGQPFLVMQHGGEDLGKYLNRISPEPFPVALAVHVLVSIADALDYLHEQLVLHLDVSPGNILLDDQDVARLTDFGASSRARADARPDGHPTRLATSFHSLNPCYAAPELYAGHGRSRSDQYSLFRVFCTLLEGRVHTSPHYEFRPFPSLASSQNAIVARALSHDAEERFESCSEPARAIADGLTDVGPQVLESDLRAICASFVHRVQLEERRLTGGTVRLGGALKLGHGLERLLQVALRWLAARRGLDPLEALRKVDPHASTLDRSTSGKVAKAILELGGAELEAGDLAAVIVRDLGQKDGPLWKLINARNDVIHGRRAPDMLLPYAAAVAALLASPR